MIIPIIRYMYYARRLSIAAYQLAQFLLKPFQANLPTIEQIEHELASGEA